MDFSCRKGDVLLMPNIDHAAETDTALSDPEARIIAAARELFMTQGFSAVSTDLLCKEAGVSKTTLYKYFGDMTGVLGAVIRREGDIFELEGETHPATENVFWQELEGYGIRLLNLLNRPFCVRLERVIYEEARQHTGLAQLFYDSAYGRGQIYLTELIAHGQAEGFISRTEPASDLSDYIAGMWRGLPLVRSHLALTECPYEDPDGRVRGCMQVLFGPAYRGR